MQYISAEEILVLHARIVDATGGLHGVRDTHLVMSIAERPKSAFGGKEFYPSLFEKAAAYFDSCARHHAFLDGNKRTAIAIAARFLFINGWDLSASNSALEQFVLVAVVEKYTIEQVANWLEKHSKKVKK